LNLLLEEDELVQNLIRQILEDAGYRVLCSRHPLDPLDVEQLRPDLLLTDLVFRRTHIGWEYLRLLRAHARTSKLPILVCTAEYEHVRAATSAELGLVNALVLKPFDVDDLLDNVRSTLPSDPSLAVVPPDIQFDDERNMAEG
jgi:CheY-like chemotaxis protein